jgi:hypothetical protein
MNPLLAALIATGYMGAVFFVFGLAPGGDSKPRASQGKMRRRSAAGSAAEHLRMDAPGPAVVVGAPTPSEPRSSAPTS